LEDPSRLFTFFLIYITIPPLAQGLHLHSRWSMELYLIAVQNGLLLLLLMNREDGEQGLCRALLFFVRSEGQLSANDQSRTMKISTSRRLLGLLIERKASISGRCPLQI
jgi:hypothetical protein